MSSLLTLIRLLLMMGGGYLVKDGFLTGDDLEKGVAAILTLLPLAWAAWNKYHRTIVVDKVEAGLDIKTAKAETPTLAK